MATNRYTQLTPASFNPLSVEETMMVPLAKQQRHDQMQLVAMQERMFNNPYLDIDREIVEQGANEIKQGLAGIEEELATKGVSRGAVRKMLDLRRKKAEFLAPSGIGGKAAANYAGYQQNIKDIQANKKMNPMDQQQAMWYAGKQYSETGGVANNASYNPYTGFESRDLSKDLMDAGSKLKPFIQKTSGWSESADGTYWIKGTQKTTTLPPEVIQQALAAYASTNPDIVNYLQEKARITPGFDPASTLMNTIQGVTPLFIRNNRESDSSRQAIPGGGQQNNPGQGSLNTFVDEVNNPFNKVFSVETGKPQGGVWGNMEEGFHMPFHYDKEGKAYRDNKDGVLREVPPSKAQKAVSQARKDTAKKLFGSNFDFNKDSDVKKWNEWVDKYGEHLGNMTITTMDPTTMRIAGFAEGVDKNSSKFVEAVNKRYNASNAVFMANGKFYASKSKMLDDLGVKDENRTKIKHTEGIVHYENPLEYNLSEGEKRYKDDFFEPIHAVVLDKDDEPIDIYISRKTQDMGVNPEVSRLRKNVGKMVKEMKWAPSTIKKADLILADTETRTLNKEKDVEIKYDFVGEDRSRPYFQAYIDDEWVPMSREAFEMSYIKANK